jgi:hypothetical protein
MDRKSWCIYRKWVASPRQHHPARQRDSQHHSTTSQSNAQKRTSRLVGSTSVDMCRGILAESFRGLATAEHEAALSSAGSQTCPCWGSSPDRLLKSPAARLESGRQSSSRRPSSEAWRRSEHDFDAARERDAWLQFETWIDDVDFLFPHVRRLPRVFQSNVAMTSTTLRRVRAVARRREAADLQGK